MLVNLIFYSCFIFQNHNLLYLMSTQPKPQKPQSIKIEPWTDFSKQLYTFFSDDFVQDKKAVVKVTANGQKGNVTIKQTLATLSKGLHDDIKVNINAKQNKHLYMRIKSGDYFKIHFDNGLSQLSGRKWNLYGTINSTRSLSNLQFKAGAQVFFNNGSTDNRLKLKMQDMAVYWYHRSMMAQQNWKFEFLGVFNLSKGLIQKNNLMFNYNHNSNHSIFVRAEVENWREAKLDYKKWSHFFDNGIVDYIGRLNDTTRIGLQAHYNLRNNKLGLQLASEKYLPDQKATIKTKIRNDLTLAIAVKMPMIFFEDLATIKKAASYNFSKKQLKWGVQYEINL